MSYTLRKEKIGRIGQRCRISSEAVVKYCQTYDDAMALLEIKNKELTSPRFNGKSYGSDGNLYVLIQSERLDCLVHYWIEHEQEDLGVTTFSLNKVEDENLHKFVEEHRKHGKSGSAGEFVRVDFSPTGLGTIAHAQCLICGAVEDLTDYDSW